MHAKAARRTGREANPPEGGKGRKMVSQSDVPAHDLEQAIRIPSAIADNYGKSPTKPLRVAQAMDLSPNSSFFRVLCGTSIAYGLTEGGYNADVISLTPLGKRIVAPTREGDDVAAKREATLRPRVIREFLTRYNESRYPTEAIARNVLEEMGVPRERTALTYKLIHESAKAVGFLREVKGQVYVDLDNALTGAPLLAELPEIEATPPSPSHSQPQNVADRSAAPSALEPLPSTRRTNRVFITHGKNQEVVTQLKDLLTFGGFTPVVAIENDTTSKPVPEKVLDDMRSCDAAVIHVGAELKLMGADGQEHRMLNQNVLIEIGAAMALYGSKFILLVERGAALPSNLQGLYEVRYEGGKLDYESTMRLLKAFNDFRA